MLALKGQSILVTRPGEPGVTLCRTIEAAGGIAVHFPTIVFAPPSNKTSIRQHLQFIPRQNWLIFTSIQAAKASLPFIKKQCPVLPKTVQLAAIGQSTAKILQAAGYTINAVPLSDWSSEGLLALPVFQSIFNQRIMIVRGEGGRQYLELILAKRGAIVSSLEVYQRVLPNNNQIDAIQVFLAQREISAIVCASFDSVNNLKVLMGKNIWPTLKQLPLIVVSDRIKQLAADLGFERIYVAGNAGHDAILNTMRLNLS